MEAPSTITIHENVYHKVKDNNIYHWEIRALYKQENSDDYILLMIDNTTANISIKVPSENYIHHITT